MGTVQRVLPGETASFVSKRGKEIREQTGTGIPRGEINTGYLETR